MRLYRERVFSEAAPLERVAAAQAGQLRRGTEELSTIAATLPPALVVLVGSRYSPGHVASPRTPAVRTGLSEHPNATAGLARLSWAAAALALLVQVYPHVGDLVRNQYARGSAWEPRVKAILDVSRVATRGGPYLAVPAGSLFQPVDRKVNDLGFSAFAYAWGGITGQPLNRRLLMGINLGILVSALLALLASAPPRARLATVVVLLLVPIPVPAYRSPDPLATHGSLMLWGIVIAASMTRAWPVWAHASLGGALFVIHTIRSAYALYAVAALLAVAGIEALRTRAKAPLLRALVVLTACLPLHILWQVPLAHRAADRRVVQQDTLGTHPIYIALLEGVGWSENRWGLKPADPWVASYLAVRFGLEPVDVGTVESERRARLTYRELWREAPLHLLGVYASRVPQAVREHTFGGVVGGALLLLALPAAVLVAWSRRDPLPGLLLALAALTACLLFQTLVLDPRLLYAYPLRLASGLALALALSVLADGALARMPAKRRAPGPGLADWAALHRP